LLLIEALYWPGKSMAEENSIPTYAVLMAGGRGTRLWPLSRAGRPKQFLALQPGGETLMQAAARRAARVSGSLDRVLVVAGAESAGLVREQLPGLPPENLLLEPQGKNTAPCLGLAAFYLGRRCPEAVMAVLPADHLFAAEEPWLAAVRTAVAHAGSTGDLVAIGIPPLSPSPSYGYLHLGETLRPGYGPGGEGTVRRVLEYIEKPPAAQAQAFLESGAYLWNTGAFAWRLPVFLEALRQHLPWLFAGLQALEAERAGEGFSAEKLERAYAGFESISVDYGVMERAGNVAAVQGDFKRIDVGGLAALAELYPADEQGNAGPGDRAARDSRGNLVYTDAGLVALLGVDDLVVVRQGDIVLVCPRARAGEVQALLETLVREGLERYL
jgi:mannose-1-phosphate guanylyltransferase